MSKENHDRPIIGIFERDADGYFVEPDVITPEIAQIIAHNTERMVKHFNYADEFIGDGNTFDVKGDTVCGGCNQDEKSECLLFDDDDNKINEADGSCRNYETRRKGDPELRFGSHGISREGANYGRSAKGGWSCWRCPASKRAKNTDDMGRTQWCGVGAIFQMWNGCCELNECPQLPDIRGGAKGSAGDHKRREIAEAYKAKR